jgi:hypothetical protein
MKILRERERERERELTIVCWETKSVRNSVVGRVDELNDVWLVGV